VALGTDLGEHLFHFSIGADHKGGPDNPLVHLTVQFFSPQAPKALRTVFSVSAKRIKGRLNFWTNFSWETGLSALIPTTVYTPLFVLPVARPGRNRPPWYTRGIILGIKVDDQRFSDIILGFEDPSVLIRETKLGHCGPFA